MINKPAPFFFSQTFPTPAHGCCLSFPRWIIISRSISSKYLAEERPQVYRGMGGEVFRGAGESDWKRAVLSGPPARCNTCGQQRTARCRQAGCQLFFSFFSLEIIWMFGTRVRYWMYINSLIWCFAELEERNGTCPVMASIDFLSFSFFFYSHSSSSKCNDVYYAETGFIVSSGD